MRAARPTIYRGTPMRSRLEAGFAQWLDDNNFTWLYEPQAFAGRRGQYLPDFVLRSVRCSWLREPADVYIEVKPAAFPGTDADAMDAWESLMRRMAIIWETYPDAVVALATPEQEDDRSAYPSVGVLDLSLSPARYDPFPWPGVQYWAKGPDGTLGLAQPISEAAGPWPHGYWSVR